MHGVLVVYVVLQVQGITLPEESFVRPYSFTRYTRSQPTVAVQIKLTAVSYRTVLNPDMSGTVARSSRILKVTCQTCHGSTCTLGVKIERYDQGAGTLSYCVVYTRFGTASSCEPWGGRPPSLPECRTAGEQKQAEPGEVTSFFFPPGPRRQAEKDRPVCTRVSTETAFQKTTPAVETRNRPRNWVVLYVYTWMLVVSISGLAFCPS